MRMRLLFKNKILIQYWGDLIDHSKLILNRISFGNYADNKKPTCN